MYSTCCVSCLYVTGVFFAQADRWFTSGLLLVKELVYNSKTFLAMSVVQVVSRENYNLHLIL